MPQSQVKLTEFNELIQSYRHDFVGRHWLIDKIGALLDERACRFIVLTGGPGLGKSAVMAHLAAKNPQWLRYFIRRDNRHLLRPSDAKTFFLTIGGQLASLRPNLFEPTKLEIIARQRIGSLESGGEAVGVRIEELRASPFYSVSIQAEQEIKRLAGKAATVEIGRLVTEPRLLTIEDLQYLGLFDPAWLLSRTDPQSQIVVLVDALDELRFSPAETNILDALLQLPVDPMQKMEAGTSESVLSGFPPNLCFILSSRREALLDSLLSRPDARELQLNIEDSDNLSDLRTYALAHLPLDDPRVAGAGANQTKDTFLDNLLKKASGNFLYLRTVIGAIAQSIEDSAPERLLDLLRFEHLPDDLNALYGYFLRSIVDWIRKSGFGAGAWREFLRPLLGVLAVAGGPLSKVQLLNFTQLDSEALADLLRELRQFVEPANGGIAFHLYHTSFAEYLLDAESNMDYHIDGKHWHDRIAAHYLQVCSQDWSTADDYGLNNLAIHLSSSGRIVDLVNLISHSWMRVRRQRAQFTYGMFDSDVGIAFRAVLSEKPPKLLSLVHLIAARLVVHENLKAYEDADLELLVQFGRSEEALNHAQLRNSPQGKFDGLLRICRALTDRNELVLAVANSARGAAKTIGDADERVRSLCSLAEQMTRMGDPLLNDLLDDVSKDIGTMVDVGARSVAERCLVSALADAKRHREAMQIAPHIDDDVQRSFALESVAIGFAAAGEFNEAELIVRRMKSIIDHTIIDKEPVQRIYARTLAGIAWKLSALHTARADQMFDDAESASASIKETGWRDDALDDVAVALTNSGRLSQAQEVVSQIKGWRRSSSLRRIVGKYAKAGEFEAAEVLINQISEVEWRSFALRDLAVEFARAGLYSEARSTEESIANMGDRASALCGIARALFQQRHDLANQVMNEAICASERIRKPSDRAGMFRYITKTLLEADDVAGARRAFEMVKQESDVSRDNKEYGAAVREMATALAVVNDAHADRLFDVALRIAKSLDELWKETELRQLATNLIDVGRYEKAWRVLDSDRGDLQRESVWRKLAGRLAEIGDDRANEAFLQTAEASQDIINPGIRDEAYGKLAAILIQNHRIEMAETVIGLIDQADLRCERLVDLALALHPDSPARARDLLALVEATALKEWTAARDQALACVISGLANCRQYDEALRVVSTIVDDLQRAAALSRLAADLLLAGDPRGEPLLNEGLRLARTGDPGDSWLEARELRREAEVLSRKADPGAERLWEQVLEAAGSLWIGWFWDQGQYRAEVVLHLAAALIRIRDPQADEFFELAHRLALEIPYENARDQTLHKLARALIAIGGMEAAERVVREIHGTSERLDAVRELVEAFTKGLSLESAIRWARSVPNDYYRREIMRSVAIAFARAGKITEALTSLEETNLDGFIQGLGILCTSWSSATADQVVSCMRAVSSVAGWVRSDWSETQMALLE